MSAGASLSHGPRRLEDVILREIAGEVFLVPIRGRLADLQELFVLNDVGEWLWQRLDGTRSQDVLVEELIASFEVTPAEAASDLDGFLRELDEAGLLEPMSAEADA